METLEIRTRIAAEVIMRISLEADGPRVLGIDIGAVKVDRISSPPAKETRRGNSGLEIDNHEAAESY